jgi:hypothetical protein
VLPDGNVRKDGGHGKTRKINVDRGAFSYSRNQDRKLPLIEIKIFFNDGDMSKEDAALEANARTIGPQWILGSDWDRRISD